MAARSHGFCIGRKNAPVRLQKSEENDKKSLENGCRRGWRGNATEEMSGGSFSTVLISLASLLVAFFFNKDPSSEHNPPYYVEDPSTAARDIIRQIHEAIFASNVTLVVELGIQGKLIAGQIFDQCNNRTADDAIRLHNWGGNFLYSTQNIQYPRTTAQVQQIVRRSNKLRVIGSRHSFTKIGDSKDTILSTLGMNSILSLNTTVPSVTVQAGITYTDLAPFLQSIGFALPNLAALAEISIGGSISTGTHGSGLTHQNLPSQVLSMQLVLANGTLATYRKEDPEWNGLAVGLGAFGVMTQIELKLENTYNVTTQVYMNMPLENLWANFDAIMNLGYTVQLFSSMTNPKSMDQVWVNVRLDSSGNPIGNLTELFGAVRAPTQVSPISILPATFLIEQGVEHPWYQGLIDYGFGLSGADGNEIQSEYIVPYEKAVPALQAVNTLNAIISPILYVWFIRTIKADNFWLSQNEGDISHLSIHFTFQPNITAVLKVLGQIDAVLQPFNARPHWGKFFTMKPDNFLKLYPKLDAFKELAKQFDPNGKFRNEFLDQNVFVNINSAIMKSS